jgi:hypothetical protein
LLAVGDFVNEPLYVFNNPYFKANSLLPGLQNQLYYDYLAVTSNGGVPSWLVTLLWKPAVYLYLLIFVVAVFAIRLRNWHGMLFALPAILQSGILFLVNPAQDFRYQYPVYLIGLFSVLLLFIRQPDSATSKPNDLGD